MGRAGRALGVKERVVTPNDDNLTGFITARANSAQPIDTMPDTIDDFSGSDEEPAPDGETVEFGWDDDRPVAGRRKAQLRKLKKKAKPGTFGECVTAPPPISSIVLNHPT